MLSSTGVKPSTSASGSQPSGNTKKDKIQQTPTSTQKNKVEAHPRKVKSSLKNKDCVVTTKGTANVQHFKLNANSKLKCVKQEPRNPQTQSEDTSRKLLSVAHGSGGPMHSRELTAMASEHSSSGPALHEMTLATISSGLVPNPHPSTPFVPPSRVDWDMLFQPLFGEFLNPSPSVDHSAPEVVAPINEVIAPVLAD
ncbi:hypothetical protein Tco_1250253 [Tanacetum coccineum]